MNISKGYAVMVNALHLLENKRGFEFFACFLADISTNVGER